MITAILCTAGYIAIAALCVYLEGRLTGELEDGPFWLLWPALLPILALHLFFRAAGKLGERHRG